MSYVIQKTANAVNLLDTKKAASKNIIYTFPIDTVCSENQLADAIVFLVDGNSKKEVPFYDIKYQDFEDSVKTWTGNIADFVNKINTEYFNNSVTANGGATANNQAITNSYLIKKNIGKILDLATSNIDPIAYPFFIDSIEIAGVVIPNPSIAQPIENSKDLAGALNNFQDSVIFTVIDANNLLINAGSLALSEINNNPIRIVANSGANTFGYAGLSDSVDVATSAEQQAVERLKEIQAILAQSKSNQDEQTALLQEMVGDYFSNVALGNVSGVMPFKKQGSNASVSTSQLPLNPAGTPIVPLTVAATISFASTSALDSAAGTGAQGLRIFGIGASGQYQVEDLALNGLTPVVTVNTWLGVLNRVMVTPAGSGQTNAGVITGLSGGNTYCTIASGTSVMKQAAFIVPANKKALIYSCVFDASKNSGGTQVFDIFIYVLQGTVKYELYAFKIDQSLGFDIFLPRKFETPLPIEAGSIWWIEAKVAGGTGWLDCEFEQNLFDV